MDTLLTILLVVAVLVVLVVVAGRAGLLKGRAPQLGVRDGRLAPPKRTPNSVTSQAALYPEASQAQYAAIEPLPVWGDGVQSIKRLRTIVAGMPGAKVIDTKPDYLYAQFTSGGLRFVDDTEFWFSPSENTVHVRSASRLGRRDFHVNRKRVEAIRASYLKAG